MVILRGSNQKKTKQKKAGDQVLQNQHWNFNFGSFWAILQKGKKSLQQHDCKKLKN